MSHRSDPVRPRAGESPSRRDLIRLLGGVVGAGMLPLNFGGCGPAGYVVDSGFIPTPEQPLTPTSQFYINYNFGLPAAPARREWRLHLRGLVQRPLSLGFDDLARLPEVTRPLTLECIGNVPGGGLISSATFTGVRVRDLLAAAGLDGHALGLAFLGLDGYPAYLSLDAALAGEALLAWAMNGAPLADVHGAPVRALFPGRHGMFSVKWLDSITATREQPTWGALRGLARFVDGATAERSRIDGVSDGATVKRGAPIDVTGLACTPGVGVARVEVLADGAWQPAELTYNAIDRAPVSPYLWTLWRFRWTPRASGAQVLSVRAVDARGRTQTDHPEFPYDSGAIHSVRVTVVDR